MTGQDVTEAFHMMWDHFPDPVMLIQRDRTIVATNLAARGQGIADGTRCFRLNGVTDGSCAGCLANQALRAGKSESVEGSYQGKSIRGYWVPLNGRDDLYLHFYVPMSAKTCQCSAA
ncbi:MAG TPA: hypothetical protein VFE30_04610 [Anaeromyxobacteraceae bacterium]|jgi:hypothetical protein|nr:hypothetical protein [Anaeromyxobacteraceae bacterium]